MSCQDLVDGVERVEMGPSEAGLNAWVFDAGVHLYGRWDTIVLV
jgi:hypothetical protein